MQCPKCNIDLVNGAEDCHICGWETETVQPEWVEIGSVDNRMMADLARETLKSMGIVAVVMSRDGFFGDAGLVFSPFFKAGGARYTIRVAAAQKDEAEETLQMTIGEQFHRGDN
jgi:hypothetical protein